MADAIQLQAQYPQEFAFPLPPAIPGGIETVELRQINYNTLPSNIQQGQEIIIYIPELEGCWMDTATTRLNFSMELTTLITVTSVFSVAAGGTAQTAARISIPFSRGTHNLGLKSGGYGMFGIVARGSCANLFQRYTVYANSTTLTDDMDEFGCWYDTMCKWTLDAPTSNQEASLDGRLCLKRQGWRILGFSEQGHFNSGMGGNIIIDPSQTLNTPITDAGITESEALAILAQRSTGYNPYQQGAVDNSFSFSASQEAGSTGFLPGQIWDGIIVLSAPAVSAGATGAATSRSYRLVYRANYQLDLPGTLGSGNERMYPMFIGPTRISLITASVDRWLTLEGPNNAVVAQAHNSGSSYAGAILSGGSDPYPRAGATVSAIRGPLLEFQRSVQNANLALALEQNLYSLSYTQVIETVAIRSMEFVCNYYRMAPENFAAVMSQLPIPARIISRVGMFAYCSVNLPVAANGLQEVLVSQRRSSNKATFVLFNPVANNSVVGRVYGGSAASVCPFLGANTCLTINGKYYPTMGLNPLRYPSDTLAYNMKTLNQSKLSVGVCNVNTYDFSCLATTDIRALSNLDGAWSLVCSSNRATNASDRSAISYGSTDISATYTERTAALSLAPFDYTQQLHMYGAGNSFALIIDTEHFSKRGFLSGVSTLSGSHFLRLPLEVPSPHSGLPFPIDVKIYVYFDGLLMFDYASKTVSIKL